MFENQRKTNFDDSPHSYHNGSMSLWVKMIVIKSANTSQMCNSIKQQVNAVHSQQDGGSKQPGVTARYVRILRRRLSPYDKRQKNIVNPQMNLTEFDVFDRNFDTFCAITIVTKSIIDDVQVVLFTLVYREKRFFFFFQTNHFNKTTKHKSIVNIKMSQQKYSLFSIYAYKSRTREQLRITSFVKSFSRRSLLTSNRTKIYCKQTQ